jgi:2-methylisocitrate lyase-like PEP mutase family enzyme
MVRNRPQTIITDALTVPVMADGEDGFGDVTAISSTIRDFIKAGVAGINIEDQVLGNPAPKQVIGWNAAVEKIKAARAAARAEDEPDLVINGRTDALAVAVRKEQGISDAIDRANRYLEAGADLAFVTGVATLEEVKLLVKEIGGPVSIAAGLPNNIRNFSIAELRECGVARVSLPTVAIFSAIAGMIRCLENIRDYDEFLEVVSRELVCSPQRLVSLMGG